MPRNIDRLVAENREEIRQVRGRFVEVDSNRDRDLKFGPSLFSVDVSASVKKRSTGSQVVFGHADTSKGFGRGTFGADRGEWVDSGSNVSTDAVFTKLGRRAVVRCLDGEERHVTRSRAGVDDSPTSSSDTSLTAAYAAVSVLKSTPPTNELETVAPYGAAEWVGDPVEFGLFDGSGNLLARVVVSGDWDIDPTDDVRLDVTLTFDGDGIGNSVVPTDGERAVRDALSDETTVTGPVEFAFGTGDADLSKSDTSLTSETFRKDCERIVGRDRIIAKTHVLESEPGGGVMPVDLSEMAVFDGDGRMIWATTFRGFTKTTDAGFNAESEIRVS